MASIEETLARLKRSPFRARFHLDASDRRLISQKGLDTIRSHTEDFVRTRLSAAFPQNDGHQTPMRGHPTFKAQHACACCCRSCLEKWYKVPQGQPLSEIQQKKIVNLLMACIENELTQSPCEKGTQEIQ